MLQVTKPKAAKAKTPKKAAAAKKPKAAKKPAAPKAEGECHSIMLRRHVLGPVYDPVALYARDILHSATPWHWRTPYTAIHCSMGMPDYGKHTR